MSPLTKLFVVLLVILALVTTSATVVFVTQTQDYNAAAQAARDQLAAARNELQQAQSAAAAERENASRTIRETQAQVEQMRQATNQVQSRVNDLAAQNATLVSQNALASADLARVTAALTSAQDQLGKQAEQIAQLRQANDDRLRQNVELNTAVTALSSENEVLNRELRFANEQLQEAKTTVDRQSSIIREAGINPKMAVAAPGPINGVVRARRDIAGIPYATISVGSNDGVAKGMKFNIINRQTGDFLGILTVDAVEQTEATGRLEGPRLKDVRAGTEVRTQL